MNRNFFLRNIFFIMILLSLVFALSACATESPDSFIEQSELASDFDVGIDGDPCPSVCYQGTLYGDTGKFYTELPEGYEYVGETINVSIHSDLGEMESWGGGTLYVNAAISDAVIMAYSGDLFDDGLPKYVVYIRSDLK